SGCRRGLDCPGECQGLRHLTGSPAAAAGPDMSRLLCGHGRRWNHHFHPAILKQRQKCPVSKETGRFFCANEAGSFNSLAVVPLPLPDLRQVHAVIL
ncbi:Large polyvalent protein associated domain-containing protein, partial [Dysosmobacter welbionis]